MFWHDICGIVVHVSQMSKVTMSEFPLVAIFTPVYNGDEFLEETMESVQAQTYPNLLHIVVNNASTDQTPEIISRYLNRKIPVLVHRNEETLPQRDNWNTAVGLVPEEARYIRLLCGDDTITPDSIAEMVAVAETDPDIGVVGCLHDCAGAVQDFGWPEDETVIDGIEAIRRILLGEGTLMPIQLLVRKSVADTRQPLFQPPLGGGHDMDAMLDLLTRSKFGFVHKCLAFTRIHENSVTSLTYNAASRSWTSDAMHFMTTYGPKAFGKAYGEQLLRFRRYYVRRILRWRREGGDEKMLSRHFEALETAGWTFGPVLIADATADWVFQRFGLRSNWTGYPGWQ